MASFDILVCCSEYLFLMALRDRFFVHSKERINAKEVQMQ